MKVEIGKAWCIRMAELEADAEIGAGRLALIQCLTAKPFQSK